MTNKTGSLIDDADRNIAGVKHILLSLHCNRMMRTKSLSGMVHGTFSRVMISKLIGMEN